MADTSVPSDPPRPLEGTRVLDLARVVSGPYAGRMLCDLGADVVKVEPPDGDLTRRWGEVRHGLSGFYTQQNAGKRNVSVDLKVPGAADLIVRLAAAADVVIENFRAGVLERLGLGWDTLSAANPRLVMLSITGFGQHGPDAGRQAYAPVLHAESGIIARQAEFDEAHPSDPMLSIADFDAALHGLAAVLAALLLRERTGRGQHIDMGMLDAMLATDDYVHHAIDGSPVDRLGGEVWDTQAGPILVASDLKNTWFELARTFDLVDPTPPGSPLAVKIACRRRAAADWFASFHDQAELTAALARANLAWADVRSPTQALAAPSVAARGMVAEVDDRGGGRRGVIQSPYRFSDATSGVRGGAAHRGEHNAEVLAEWLGLAAADVEELAAAGVLR